MTITAKLRNALRQETAQATHEDVVFGLPLEAGDRKIYPVFVEPDQTVAESNGHPRQIGYVEVDDGWADYTSLERTTNWTALFAGAAIASLIVIWVLRRIARGMESARA